MSRITELSIDSSETQVEIALAVTTVREQFAKIKTAVNQHEFLQENLYIKWELLDLEELLIKAGLLEPRDLEGQSNDKEFNEKMEDATKVFYDVV